MSMEVSFVEQQDQRGRVRSDGEIVVNPAVKHSHQSIQCAEISIIVNTYSVTCYFFTFETINNANKGINGYRRSIEDSSQSG